MTRFTALAPALGLALAAVGCGKPDAVETTDLVGPTWELTLFQDGTASPVVVAEPARYTLRFGSDGRAAVRSDCNACSGESSLSGASFRIGPLACTRAFCGTGSLDPAYPAALDRARGVTMDSAAELAIHGDGVTLRYRAGPAPSPSPSAP